jgi:K+-transporting ATPase ATPase C chain
MKTIATAVKLLLIMTVITGLVYPLLITTIAGFFFPHEAGGSLLKRDNKLIGSEFIGQAFADEKYVWPRPSSIGYNPLPSSGSNLGPTSADLKAAMEQRKVQLRDDETGNPEIPVDLLCASGSGLDPHISPEAARYQIDRILRARGLDHSYKTIFNRVIESYTEPRTWDLFGQPRVHVLKLNLALDSLVRVQRH